jgi:hypothetical protein
MDANTYPLRSILSQERRYLIPTFQRDYEWTQVGQWELLFDDLDSVADRLESARALAEQNGDAPMKAEKSVPPHFLGAIVLDQLPSSAGGIDLRSVIDGQQRLTTIQLLLRGLLDVLIELDSQRAVQVRRLLENPMDVIDQADEQHKLWPRRHDRDVWRDVMADSGEETKHLYWGARRFFADRVRLSVQESAGDSSRADVLVDAVLSLFKIVVIDLEDNDDAQVIFEVLNGRQTPLSAADLVKNLLFLRAELADEAELEQLYDRYWAAFDEKWWKQTVGRGHAARGRRDLLLSSWLAAASGAEPNIGHLYNETRRYVEKSARKMPDLLAELRTYGDSYEAVYLRTPRRTLRVNQAYARLDRLGVTTALPLLLWLETLDSTVLAPSDHERAVLAVESWVVRRVITGVQTRGYGKVFIDVLADARSAAPGTVADAVVTSLGSLDSTHSWPSDSEVRDAFVEVRVYDKLSQERVRMLLGALDGQLQSELYKGEQAAFEYDKLQIEHLMPRKWTAHWPLEIDDVAARELASQRRNAWVDRIGNLTLLTAPLNSSVSNGPWEKKRSCLKEHSQLVLNAQLLDVETWDEDAITARGRALAEVACRVWGRSAPNPAPPPVEATTEPAA